MGLRGDLLVPTGFVSGCVTRVIPEFTEFMYLEIPDLAPLQIF